MNEHRLALLETVAPSKSAARRMAMQTEHWSDETLRELVAFKLIEAAERIADACVAAAVRTGHPQVAARNVVVPRDGRAVTAWTRAVLEAMVDAGSLAVSREELAEFFDRREIARNLAPKGKAVRYPREPG